VRIVITMRTRPQGFVEADGEGAQLFVMPMGDLKRLVLFKLGEIRIGRLAQLGDLAAQFLQLLLLARRCGMANDRPAALGEQLAHDAQHRLARRFAHCIQLGQRRQRGGRVVAEGGLAERFDALPFGSLLPPRGRERLEKHQADEEDEACACHCRCFRCSNAAFATPAAVVS
jgi:hypothetical protein